MTNHKTAYQHAMKIADHIDEVGESPYELVRQLHTAGLITPDPSEGCATYYDPYEPDDSAPIYRLEPKEGTP
ncbi:hypothetical protein ACN4BX_04120 [Corynebacterium macclintockiae]|uniref:hypothetical protein n=1 Tax=Corynebacterium macclintockiae TaxID=2913501 RepID=UPI003EBBD17D